MAGTFNFAEEFPEYRFIDSLEEVQREKERKRDEAPRQEAARKLAESKLKSCNQVFESYREPGHIAGTVRPWLSIRMWNAGPRGSAVRSDAALSFRRVTAGTPLQL
jgi:hypothetical protein